MTLICFFKWKYLFKHFLHHFKNQYNISPISFGCRWGADQLKMHVIETRMILSHVRDKRLCSRLCTGFARFIFQMSFEVNFSLDNPSVINLVIHVTGSDEFWQQGQRGGTYLQNSGVAGIFPGGGGGGGVVRASASRSGGRGFEPRPDHTKDLKNGTYCLLVRRSAFTNGEGKLNTLHYQWTNPLL